MITGWAGGIQQDAAGRHPRPVRRAGDHPHQLSRGRPRASSRSRLPTRSPRPCCRCRGPGSARVPRSSAIPASCGFEAVPPTCTGRGHVLEYLNQAASKLPDGIQLRIGPTPPGWLGVQLRAGRSQGQHDLAQLRSLQDWFLKYELQTVPGGELRSPPSAAWCASTRWWSIRRSCVPTASP